MMEIIKPILCYFRGGHKFRYLLKFLDSRDIEVVQKDGEYGVQCRFTVNLLGECERCGFPYRLAGPEDIVIFNSHHFILENNAEAGTAKITDQIITNLGWKTRFNLKERIGNELQSQVGNQYQWGKQDTDRGTGTTH